MVRLGSVIIHWDGVAPVISAPEPWHSRLLTIRQIFLTLDVFLVVMGLGLTVIGSWIGAPIVAGAIIVFVLISVTKHDTTRVLELVDPGDSLSVDERK